MKQVLVIGGSGFIGRNLVRSLIKSGHQVSVVDRAALTDRFISEYKFDQVNYLQGEITDSVFITNAVKNKNLVYYLVSATVPFTSWDKPTLEVENNLLPFMKVVDACVLGSVEKIAFISSGGTVYGKQKGILKEDSLTKPFSPYGIFKLCQENYLEYCKVKHNLNYDVYRVTNAYGPDQRAINGFGVIDTWVKNYNAGIPIKIYGEGNQMKDFIFIDDIVNFLSLSLRKKNSSETYNVSSNSPCSIKELFEIFNSLLPQKIEPVFIPQSQSDNEFSILDNSKIVSEFDQYEFVSLKEGLKRVLDYNKLTIK